MNAAKLLTGATAYEPSNVIFVGAAWNSTASPGGGSLSVTFPAHQAGDLIMCFATYFGVSGLPSVPSAPAGYNWTIFPSRNGFSNSGGGSIGGYNYGVYAAFKVAASSSELSGSWNNTSTLMCIIVRGQSSSNNGIGSANNRFTLTGSSQLVYGFSNSSPPGMQVNTGSSAVVAFVNLYSLSSPISPSVPSVSNLSLYFGPTQGGTSNRFCGTVFRSPVTGIGNWGATTYSNNVGVTDFLSAAYTVEILSS